MDVAIGTNRLARFVGRWDEKWCPAELHHQMGYWMATHQYQLHFVAEQELWEDLYVECYSDAQYDNNPRSHGGHLISFSGHAGTNMPVTWESKLHQGARG